MIFSIYKLSINSFLISLLLYVHNVNSIIISFHRDHYLSLVSTELYKQYSHIIVKLVEFINTYYLSTHLSPSCVLSPDSMYLLLVIINITNLITSEILLGNNCYRTSCYYWLLSIHRDIHTFTLAYCRLPT